MHRKQALFSILMGVVSLAIPSHANDEDPAPQLVQVTVPEMFCSACVTHVSQSLKEIEGAGQVAVFLDPRLAFCEIPYGESLTVIERKLKASGYEVSNVSKLYDVSFDEATERWRK